MMEYNKLLKYKYQMTVDRRIKACSEPSVFLGSLLKGQSH